MFFVPPTNTKRPIDFKITNPFLPRTITSDNWPNPNLLVANPPEFTNEAAIAESSDASAFDLLKNATLAPVTVITAKVSICDSLVIALNS